ncbi:MAG: arginine repressor [Bacteroidota bacterium]|jgi:transcriptional regulator of arginine metabolism
MNKTQRQFVIKEIIRDHSVTNQEELVAMLKKRGITATQATLSRDFSELGVVRIHTKENNRYALSNLQDEPTITPLVTHEVVGIESNEAVIVVRTLPGRAGGVASFIDSGRNKLILGTLAGDDTVLVTPASVKKIPLLLKQLKELLLS